MGVEGILALRVVLEQGMLGSITSPRLLIVLQLIT